MMVSTRYYLGICNIFAKKKKTHTQPLFMTSDESLILCKN